MTTVAAEVLQWGWERARTGPWRGDGHIAYLAPLAPAGAPSVGFLQRCLETLTARGFTRVVTSALAPAEQGGFLAVGFEEYERLHLLSHDLADVPRPAKDAARLLRRGRAADWPAVLAVDASAFAPFWRLDTGGLSEAIDATPVTRFRVASPGRGSVLAARGGPPAQGAARAGLPAQGAARARPPAQGAARPQGGILAYAVTGLSANQGYLQRLAVHPEHRRAGLGRALGLDGLRWLRRKGVSEAVVNTQIGNDAALALYLSLGFRHEPIQLSVLHRRLG